MKAKTTVTLTLTIVAALLAQSLLFADANFTPLPELPAPICIKVDGAVEPAEAPIQQVGNTYTLTGDINNTIEIQLSNIVLDGDGFTVTKPSVATEQLMMPVGWLPGVSVDDVSNVKVTNIVFDDCITGVAVKNSTEVTVSQNTMKNCKSGVVVLSSSDVDIIGNHISSFGTGIKLLSLSPDSPDPIRLTIEGNQIISNSKQAPSAPAPQLHAAWDMGKL